MLATAPLTFTDGPDAPNTGGKLLSKKDYFLHQATVDIPADLFSDGQHWPVSSVLSDGAIGSHLTPGAVAVPATNEARLCARETGGQFVLEQNFPNPYIGETTIPFTLTNEADVRLELFDPLGRKVAGILRRGMAAGEQTIHVNLHGLDLPAGPYVYQLQVANRYGTYQQRKLMTAGH